MYDCVSSSQLVYKYGQHTVLLLLSYLPYILCPLRPTCHPLKGLPKSPQPTFMAILSLYLALWAGGPQAFPYPSIFSLS